jgi:Aerotolerance regulator N-terminal/von Willebrand factor type A domain
LLIVKFMVFLAPVTLLGLLLVSLPLLIHLLVRRRGRRLDFPSLRFLRETPSFKLYPRRIRQPLLLALRAAAIILLVMGLARPLFTSNTKTPEAVRFILMDASLSMKTRGRAEAAREQARAIVDKLKSGERAGVIAFSSEALVMAKLTGDKERLLEAIGRYRPTGGAVDYRAGFAEIRRQLQTEPQVAAQADIISDFQESGLEERAEIISREAAQLRISTYGVGTESERNAFLIDEEVEKTERGLALTATELVSEADGRSGARRVWTIEESEGATPEIEWRTETNKQITGRLKVLGPDDFDADDERFFAFAPQRETRVLLIEDESGATPYLNAALEASTTNVGATRFVLERRKDLPLNSTDLAPFSLIVVTLHGAAQENEARTLLEYAREGGTVWMFLARDVDAASWNRLASGDAGRALPFESIARKSGSPSLTFGAMDTDAPQLQGLDESALAALGAVRVSESFAVTPRAQTDTLMRWSDGTPAFISARAGAGTMMLMATSPERASGELGLTPAFPALVSSISRAAAKTREPLSQVIGEAVRLNVAPETEVKITNAQGGVSVTKARELVRRPLNYFNEPGVYHLEFAGQQKFLAFNAPVLESERALTPVDELKRRFPVNEERSVRAINVAASREAMERSGSLWRYFLCAAFLLMIAELFVAVRGHGHNERGFE